jgi:hypothetical protein
MADHGDAKLTELLATKKSPPSPSWPIDALAQERARPWWRRIVVDNT